MTLVRIAMNALPEKQEEVLQTLISMIASTGKESGCLSHSVFRDIEDNNVFSLIEQWETRSELIYQVLGMLLIFHWSPSFKQSLIAFISFFEKKFKPIGACSGYKIAGLFLSGHFIPAPFFNEFSSLP